MEQARRLDHPPSGETAAVKRAKLGAKFFDPRLQPVGIALVNSFGNQPGEQDLSFVQCGRQFGQPAGAAGGPQCG